MQSNKFSLENSELRYSDNAVPEIRDAQGRLLAPNGQPSKLNEAQWRQVRTPEFKAWFGDWEWAWHQARIDEGPVVRMDWNSPQTTGLHDLRVAALKEAAQRFLPLDEKTGQHRPEKFKNAETGDEIWVSMAGMKAAVSKHSFGQKMRVLTILPGLIKSAHFVSAAPDEKQGRKGVLGYRYYVSKTRIDDKDYYVRLAVREIEDSGVRRKFYDHEMTEISEAAGKSGTARLQETTGHPPATASLDFIRHHGWRQFNGEASRVVDENGEPLVVYHGTYSKNGFTEFGDGLMGTRGVIGGRGFYFAKSPEVASHYAATIDGFNVRDAEDLQDGETPHVMAAFLNIRDPIKLGGSDKRASERAVSALIMSGLLDEAYRDGNLEKPLS